MYLGRHLLVEMRGVKPSILEYMDCIESFMRGAIFEAGMTALNFSQVKSPNGGYTAVFILQESHLIVHTYPDYGIAMIDCYTCGQKGSPEQAIICLREFFEPISVECHTMPRGLISSEVIA